MRTIWVLAASVQNSVRSAAYLPGPHPDDRESPSTARGCASINSLITRA